MADETSGGAAKNPVTMRTVWSESELATYVNQLSLSTDGQGVYLTFFQTSAAIGQAAMPPVSAGSPQVQMQFIPNVPVKFQPVARLVVTPQTLRVMVKSLQQLSEFLEGFRHGAASDAPSTTSNS
jgi:hypothetical protein